MTNKSGREAVVFAMVDIVQTYRAQIDPAHTPEDILSPSYWADTPALTPGDVIVVETQDVAWTQQLRVMDVDKIGARTLVEPLTDVRQFKRGKVPDGFKIVFESLYGGFTVLNRSDERIASGYRTHQGALTWLMTQVGQEQPVGRGKQREPADV
jgi:hypothetical protein